MEPLGIGKIFNVDTMTSIYVPHILEKIFLSLDYESFNICSAVSTDWNNLLSSESFLKLKKDVFREDIEKELDKALCEGFTPKIIKLVSSGMVNLTYEHEDLGTLLHVAADKGDTRMIQYLIEKGAEINAINKIGSTALCNAAEEGHIDAVKMLLDKGACPNMGEITPMHEAAKQGHVEVLHLLLNRGAEVNPEVPENGLTPLHGAAMMGRYDVAKMLLENGADHSMASRHGETPLMTAQFALAEYYSHSGHKGVVDILRQYGAF